MRLICPNCGAQYEVPTEVIPDAGRDVQCSDCGTTWFQHHPDHPPAVEDAQTADGPAPAAAPSPAEDTSDDWQDDTADYGAEEDDTYAEDLPEDKAEEETVAPPEPKRREIDPSVADVLREEAERETRAREQDRGTVETQQELGLTETDNDAQRRSEEARARMARLRGEVQPPSVEDDLDDIDPASRRNLLPDIDEINSSLDSDRSQDEAPAAPVVTDMSGAKPKSGFRSGFRLAVILAVLALLIYIFAPQLAEMVPQLTAPLAAYVDTVNGWRAGLDDLIQNLASSLSEGGGADG